MFKAGHPCVLVIVFVFVLFGCVVLGLGFLSSLPLQLVCHTQSCIFMYLWIVGGYIILCWVCMHVHKVSPICGKECDCVQGEHSFP